MTDMNVRSPAFEEGSPIPSRYGYTEENVNPPLAIEGVSAPTESLVLLVDSSASESSTDERWDHWLVWDIPPSVEGIPEGWSPDSATEGQNDFGEHGYGGPNPTSGEGTYRFRLYAMETVLELPPTADKDELVEAIIDHRLDKAQLEGTYAP